jgi:hypothetical protein
MLQRPARMLRGLAVLAMLATACTTPRARTTGFIGGSALVVVGGIAALTLASQPSDCPDNDELLDLCGAGRGAAIGGSISLAAIGVIVLTVTAVSGATATHGSDPARKSGSR